MVRLPLIEVLCDCYRVEEGYARVAWFNTPFLAGGDTHHRHNGRAGGGGSKKAKEEQVVPENKVILKIEFFFCFCYG